MSVYVQRYRRVFHARRRLWTRVAWVGVLSTAMLLGLWGLLVWPSDAAWAVPEADSHALSTAAGIPPRGPAWGQLFDQGSPSPETDLVVSKFVDSVLPAPGAEIEYYIHFENEGNAAARDVRLTDTLPLSVAYVSEYNAVGFAAVITGHTVVWTRPVVNPGESGVLSLRVRITDTAQEGQALVNVAAVGSRDVDVDPSDDVYTHTTIVITPKRDMHVEKSLDDGTPLAGNEITYRLYFRNQGNAPAADVVLTDTLPFSTTFVGWSGYADDKVEPVVSVNQVVWHLETIGVNQDGTIYPTVRVSDTAPVGAMLSNVVKISTSDPDIDASDDVATHTLAVAAPTRDLHVAKSLDSGVPLVGNQVVYRIDFENEGNSTAADVRLSDTLPVSMAFVSWYGYAYNPLYVDLDQLITPTVDGKQVLWDLGALASGGWGYIYPTVHISEAASIGDMLTNTVAVGGSDADVHPGDNQSFHATEVVSPMRDIKIIKSFSGGTRLAGSEIVYQVYFRNQGNTTAADVVITDTLPASTTFVSWSGYTHNPGYQDLEELITPTLSGGQVIWHVGALAAKADGYLYPRLHIADGALGGQVLTNVVRAETGDVDVDPTNNVYTRTTTVVASQWDLSVDQGVSAGAPLGGEDIEYQIAFENEGNEPAHDVIITDTLPLSAAYVSDHNAAGFTTVITGPQVVFTRATVAAGESGHLYLQVRLTDTLQAGDRLTNVVQISTSDGDDDPGDNTLAYALVITDEQRDLQVTKSLAQGPPLVGGEITYRIDFANQGNATAAGVVLTDTLPVSTSWVSWSGTLYNPDATDLTALVTPTVNGHQVTWPLGALVAGGYGQIDLTVQVSETARVRDVLINRVQVLGDDLEAYPDDNVYTHTVTVYGPVYDVHVLQSLDSGTPLAGDEMTYRLDFENQGNATVAGVVVTGTLPASTTLLSWSGHAYNPDYVDLTALVTPVVSGNQIVWPLGTLVAGGYGHVYPTVRVTDTAQGGQVLTSVAQISTQDEDWDPTDDVDVLTTTVLLPPVDMYVSTVLYEGTELVGNAIEYRIFFRNQSDRTASNVIITDTLPAHTDWVSWRGSAYNPDHVVLDALITATVSGGHVTWHLGDVVPSGRGYIYPTLRISDTAQVGDVLTNAVRVSTSDNDIDPTDDRATAVTTVAAPARDMHVEKAVEGGTPMPGDEIEYALYFENEGNSTATDVVITDTLPVSMALDAWSGYAFNPDYIKLDETIVPTVAGRQIVWPLGDVVAGGKGRIYPVLHVDDAALGGQVVTNVVQVATREQDVDETDDTAVLTTTLLTPPADLSVSKSVEGVVAAPGAQITYHIALSNVGDKTAVDIILTDTLPASARYVAQENAVGLTTVITGDTVIWTAPALYAGETGDVYLRVWITDTTTAGDLLTNVVRVAMANDDVGPENDVYTDTMTLAPPNPPLSLTVRMPMTGIVDTACGVTATVHPATTTTPLLYRWQASDQLPVTHHGGLKDSLSLAWATTGTHAVTVTVSNVGGAVTATHLVTISTPPLPCPRPLTAVHIAGPTAGDVALRYVLSGTVQPADATAPLSYTWTPEPEQGQGTAYATFSWAEPGVQTVALTAENCGARVSDTHVLTISVPPPACPRPLERVNVTGPARGETGAHYVLSATVQPADATAPLTYTWTPQPEQGQGTAYATFSWAEPGVQTATLTTENCGARVSDTHALTISLPPSTCPWPLQGVGIVGPVRGETGGRYVMSATLQPPDATPPLIYTWSPDPVEGQDTARAAFTWAEPGRHAITLTAENCGARVSATHRITLSRPIAPPGGVTVTVGPDVGARLVYTAASGLTTTVDVPLGAVSRLTTLAYTPLHALTEPITSGLRFAQHAFDLDAYQDGERLPGFAFERPVTVTVRYAESDLAQIDPRTLRLYYWAVARGRWIDVVTTCDPASAYVRHPAQRWLSVGLCHLSRFGVFGETPHTIYLPLVCKDNF